jgi:hypothetical protein
MTRYDKIIPIRVGRRLRVNSEMRDGGIREAEAARQCQWGNVPHVILLRDDAVDDASLLVVLFDRLRLNFLFAFYHFHRFERTSCHCQLRYRYYVPKRITLPCLLVLYFTTL